MIWPVRAASRSRRWTTSRTIGAALNLVGYEGVAMIAVSGLDMAVWDALARPPACRWRSARRHARAGACLQQQRSLADRRRHTGARSRRTGRRGRIQGPRAPTGTRPSRRRSCRDPGGSQRRRRRHQADGRLQSRAGAWRCPAPLPWARRPGPVLVEEPIAYDNLVGYVQLTRELKTPVQLGRELLRTSRSLSRRSGQAQAIT